MTIAEIRQDYANLRDQSLGRFPERASLINRLWAAWDRELALYGDGAEPVNQSGVAVLTQAIRQPLDDDVIFPWLDTYPSGVIDRMAGGMFA